MKFNNILKSFFSRESVFSIRRFTLIGSTIFIGKVVLVLIAYFFSESLYNEFNKAYFTSSVLILFGTLGFHYAVNQVKISFKYLLFAVVINILVTFAIMSLVSRPFTAPPELLSVFLYSLFASLSGIYIFQLLFSGEYVSYAKLTFIYALLHILIIPAVLFLGVSIFAALPAAAFCWFLAGYPLFIKAGKGINNLKDLYKVGSAAFIINSAVPLALVADKYIVNHFFPLETANAYTFAWGLTAPLFYIGTLIEKIIYSSTDNYAHQVIKKSFLILLIMVAAYSFSVVLIVSYLPSLLPGSVNHKLLENILLFMITGYSFYVLFHFPVNGYLFKFLEFGKQKLIAFVYAVLIVVLSVFMLSAGVMNIKDYKLLLLVIWGYIFTLLIVKTYLIFFRHSSEPDVLKY